MKRIIFALTIAVGLVACGNNSTETKPDPKKEPEKKDTPATDDLSENPDYKKGLALIKATDCFTCHKVDEKVTGPSYKEVAQKYAGANDETITKIAQRIIKGGNGVWGDVFMTPHPAISEEDAKAMVKYVLLLK